jgi:hypothetical protein
LSSPSIVTASVVDLARSSFVDCVARASFIGRRTARGRQHIGRHGAKPSSAMPPGHVADMVVESAVLVDHQDGRFQVKRVRCSAT